MRDDLFREIFVWTTVAFGCWLLLIAPLRRVHLPEPVAFAAALSWIVARLCMWTVPLLIHWLRIVVYTPR